MRASPAKAGGGDQAGPQYRAGAVRDEHLGKPHRQHHIGKPMEIILREDIDKLGQRGQVVKVAAGYARNYLLPRKLAVTANESNKKIVEQERQAHLKKDAKHVADAQELAKLMAAASVTISQKAGENDQLFGSVTASDIA